MVHQRTLEFAFFFSLLIGVGYLVWLLIAPFAGSLALAAIIVTICYPLYEWVLARTPRKNRSLASFASLFIVVLIVILPLAILSSFLLREALSVYNLVNTTTYGSFVTQIAVIETFVQRLIPSFSLDIASMLGHFPSVFFPS